MGQKLNNDPGASGRVRVPKRDKLRDRIIKMRKELAKLMKEWKESDV